MNKVKREYENYENYAKCYWPILITIAINSCFQRSLFYYTIINHIDFQFPFSFQDITLVC